MSMFNGGGILDNAKVFFQSRTGMIVIGVVVVAIIVTIILSIRNKENYIGPSRYDSRAMYGNHTYVYDGTQNDLDPNGEDWDHTVFNRLKKKGNRQGAAMM